MPKLLSRSKHEEFKSNLELQVRNQKKREAETRRREEAESRAAKLPHAPLFTFHCTAHFPAPFNLFDSFDHFLVVSPNC